MTKFEIPNYIMIITLFRSLEIGIWGLFEIWCLYFEFFLNL